MKEFNFDETPQIIKTPPSKQLIEAPLQAEIQNHLSGGDYPIFNRNLSLSQLTMCYKGRSDSQLEL